ncbi:unnamed protein product [Scytosiphon promiscuus]
MGWFGGLITQQSQKDTRHLHDYCVQLEVDQSTRKMKFPLDKYSGDSDAAVIGSWVLLGSTGRSRRVRRTNVTLVDQEGRQLLLHALVFSCIDNSSNIAHG